MDPIIGCNVLAEPFFLPRERWIPVPASWAPNIVQGKTYDSTKAEGAALWDAVARHYRKISRSPTTRRKPMKFLGTGTDRNI